MTFDCEDDEADRLVATAGDLEIVTKIQPRPSPVAQGADESPANEAAREPRKRAFSAPS